MSYIIQPILDEKGKFTLHDSYGRALDIILVPDPKCQHEMMSMLYGMSCQNCANCGSTFKYDSLYLMKHSVLSEPVGTIWSCPECRRYACILTSDRAFYISEDRSFLGCGINISNLPTELPPIKVHVEKKFWAVNTSALLPCFPYGLLALHYNLGNMFVNHLMKYHGIIRGSVRNLAGAQYTFEVVEGEVWAIFRRQYLFPSNEILAPISIGGIKLTKEGSSYFKYSYNNLITFLTKIEQHHDFQKLVNSSHGDVLREVARRAGLLPPELSPAFLTERENSLGRWGCKNVSKFLERKHYKVASKKKAE